LCINNRLAGRSFALGNPRGAVVEKQGVCHLTRSR
jgi:hypothetical protein